MFNVRITCTFLLFAGIVLIVAADQETTPKPESESGIKLTGNKFQGKQIEGWQARIEKVKTALVSNDLEFVSGKFSIPTSLDPKLIDEYHRLKGLPPIESYFFGVPETVCFPDERVQVADTTVMPYSANCQLVMSLSGGAQAIGTGWLLGPKLVITAGHCVHGGKDEDFFEGVEIIPGMNGPVRPFGSQMVSKSKLRVSNDWKTSGSVALDYGAIILDEPFISPSGAKPGNFNIQVLSDTDLTGKSIFLSGYPADKAFGSQWKDSDPLNSVQASRLRYMLDTFGGQSGSAVIPVGESSAIGIHNYGGCPNHCTRITAEVKADIDAWLQESNNL